MKVTLNNDNLKVRFNQLESDVDTEAYKLAKGIKLNRMDFTCKEPDGIVIILAQGNDFKREGFEYNMEKLRLNAEIKETEPSKYLIEIQSAGATEWLKTDVYPYFSIEIKGLESIRFELIAYYELLN